MRFVLNAKYYKIIVFLYRFFTFGLIFNDERRFIYNNANGRPIIVCLIQANLSTPANQQKTKRICNQWMIFKCNRQDILVPAPLKLIKALARESNFK